MRFYFARHGESLANLTRTFSNRDAWHPLTDLGKHQSEELAEKLADESISHLFCSPAIRAQETASIVGHRLGLLPVVVEALREFDVGKWEGTDAPQGWEEWEEVTTAWRSGALECRVSDGESLSEILDRMVGWLDAIQRHLPAKDRVLAIGHGGIYHGALPHILAGVETAFCWEHRLGNCDVVLAEADDGVLHGVRWGDATIAAR